MSDPQGLEAVQVTRYEPQALIGPIGLMVALAGLATFYLAPFVFPFALSAAAVVLGGIGVRRSRDELTMTALVLGGVGLVLEILALLLAP